jgi:hypothetical protein
MLKYNIVDVILQSCISLLHAVDTSCRFDGNNLAFDERIWRHVKFCMYCKFFYGFHYVLFYVHCRISMYLWYFSIYIEIYEYRNVAFSHYDKFPHVYYGSFSPLISNCYRILMILFSKLWKSAKNSSSVWTKHTPYIYIYMYNLNKISCNLFWYLVKSSISNIIFQYLVVKYS